MKNIILLITFTLLSMLVGVANAKTKQDKETETIAHEQQLEKTFGKKFDSAFSNAGVDFSAYEHLYVEPLDLSNVRILKQSGYRRNFRLKPWVLTKKDREYYKKQYHKSATRYLLEDGVFSEAESPGARVLVLRSEIVQIAPLGAKSEIQTGRVESFSQGFGRMTISMKLYDGETNQLLAIISDRRELGKLWEKSNRARDYAHIRQGFNVWMKRLSVAIENA